jgi:hypothetical protein
VDQTEIEIRRTDGGDIVIDSPIAFPDTLAGLLQFDITTRVTAERFLRNAWSVVEGHQAGFFWTGNLWNVEIGPETCRLWNAGDSAEHSLLIDTALVVSVVRRYAMLLQDGEWYPVD